VRTGTETVSLLDDVRELTDALGRREDGLCLQCGKREGHWDFCPFPKAEIFMPKIVAALEAAERLLEVMRPTQYAIPARVICRVCHSEGPGWTHTDVCPWQTLATALKDEPT
jgi:hypothetical protein